MKLTFKSLRTSEAFSRETLCYTATVCIDGVPAFTAENDGHGGCDLYRAIDGKQQLLRDAEVWAKSLPPRPFMGMMLPSNLEMVISNLIQRVQTEKRFDRLTKKSALVVEGGKCWTYKTTPVALADLVAKLVASGKKVLNAMPRDEALALFKRVA